MRRIIAPFLTDHRQLYHGAALAIVQPATTAAVSQLLRLCNDAAHRRGAPGRQHRLLRRRDARRQRAAASCSALRRMNRIRSVDAANFSMVAEAGCTLASVQAGGRMTRIACFRSASAPRARCQIGGNLATNAGGTAVLRYGMTRDLTLGIEVVLADGSVISQLSPLRKDNTGYDLRHLHDRQRGHARRDHRGLPQAVSAHARARPPRG